MQAAGGHSLPVGALLCVNHGAQTQRHPGGRARMVAPPSAIQQTPRRQEGAPGRKPPHSGHRRKPSSPKGDLRRANPPLAASANRGSEAGRTRKPPETSASRDAPNNNSGKVSFDKASRSARRNRFGSGTKLIGCPKSLPPACSAGHIAVKGLGRDRGQTKPCPLFTFIAGNTLYIGGHCGTLYAFAVGEQIGRAHV